MLLLGVARDQVKLAEGVKLRVLIGRSTWHFGLHFVRLACISVRMHVADSMVDNVVAMDAACP